MPHLQLPCRLSFGLLALVGSLLCGTGAMGADLDPGYADVPAPIPQQNVTFGSGWYIRGDLGATDKYGLDVEKGTGAKLEPRLTRGHDVGYDLSIGGGYSFTNNIRADLTGDFLQPVQGNGAKSVNFGGKKYAYNYSSIYNSYVALVNAYYDIGCWSIFTPYIGAGVGMGIGNINSTFSGGISDQKYSEYYNLAWAAMAGVAIDVSTHAKLDIGYRYLNMGTFAHANIYDHEVRIGARYMIDN